MDKLQIALVLGATFLAVRSLVTMMSGHREHYLKTLVADLAEKQKEAAASEAAANKANAAKATAAAKPGATKPGAPKVTAAIKPGSERTAAPAKTTA